MTAKVFFVTGECVNQLRVVHISSLRSPCVRLIGFHHQLALSRLHVSTCTPHLSPPPHLHTGDARDSPQPTYTINEDETLVASAFNSNSLLAKPGLDPKLKVFVQAADVDPAVGSFVSGVNTTDGAFTYQPLRNYYAGLDSFAFTYGVTLPDGSGQCSDLQGNVLISIREW